jgi:hypothetical protein
MKIALNNLNSQIENEIVKREENESEVFNSMKEVNLKVKASISDEKLKREQFEENICKLLEETTKQLSLIN